MFAVFFSHLHLRGAPGIQQDGFHLADVSDVPVQARAALTDKRAQGVGRPLGICKAESTAADSQTLFGESVRARPPVHKE